MGKVKQYYMEEYMHNDDDLEAVYQEMVRQQAQPYIKLIKKMDNLGTAFGIKFRYMLAEYPEEFKAYIDALES